MGWFTNKELTESQIQNLNNLLPDKFRKATWKENDFAGNKGIYGQIDNYLNSLTTESTKLKTKQIDLKNSIPKVIAKNIKIFNTELFEAKPLGMVDVGMIEQFSGPSTGDRFAVGAVGYFVEKAIDDSFAKSNKQEEAVNKTKLALITKAKAIFPNCNMLFKYEVDFREMGSSGNVFIYMRATAAVGKNEIIEKAVKNIQNELKNLEEKIDKINEDIENIKLVQAKVPADKWQIKELL